ncbi:MAG: magnesium-translocating P-type ATPase [Magnetococcus sp. DMHC-1]
MFFNVIKDKVLSGVASRRYLRHFQRLIILESLRGLHVGREATPDITKNLLTSADKSPEELLRQLGSRQDGLTASESKFRLEKHGLNQVEHEKPLHWWMHLWFCYNNPFNLLLTTLAIVSYYTEDMKATLVIAAMVALSTILRFTQEIRSNRAADRLKEMVSTTATVLRCDPRERAAPIAQQYFGIKLHPGSPMHKEVPLRQLVPGDVVILSAGDMIPADVRLLTAKDLFVSQSALTGEALPVEKFVVSRNQTATTPLHMDNLCFMGTTVVSGSARAVVVGTGNKTYFGALAARLTNTHRAATAFQAGVDKVSWLLIRFMLVMTPIVLLINGFTKGDWLEASLFSLSVAVGLTPEMLPMIVTTTLAKGAVILSRKKVIVKRLDAIQNFGAMDVLCTDKTGTLTQDRIFLERHTNILGEESEEVLEHAYLNSYYQTGLKNLLDRAVLEHAEVRRELNVATNFRKVDEIPFDFQRRRMSVVVSQRDDLHLLICKGALEEVLAVCSDARHGEEGSVPLTRELLERIGTITRDLNDDGLRVVAVAVREFPPDKTTYSTSDERDLTLIGYIAFLDPPKETTAPALEMLRKHGVAVKILTGDNELVTAKVCREVGLAVDGLLLGADMDRMSDAELAVRAENVTVFAKLTPTQKERIVRVLHDSGHVVGFLGDGINDAPALRAADIGISVDSAVDIAKESADIILLEKSLMVLEEGVIEGRRTFANMLKYIKMTASSNFGNVFSVLVASAFIPFLPMLPMHLLVQNLLYDISQIAIPFDNVDQEFLAKPQQWNPGDMGRFMVFFGPVSSVFDLTTYALMWFVFQANGPDHQTLFQSGWFIEGLLSQTLIVHMIRTRHVPFFQSRAGWPLLLMTGVIAVVGIAIPMGPLAEYLKLQPLPLAYFGWLTLILTAYAFATQGVKGIFARRYGWQ